MPTAPQTLDQSQTSITAWEHHSLAATDGQQAAQTFTAGLSGQLYQVDLPLRHFEAGPGLTVEIRTVSGDAPTDTSLATASVPDASVPTRTPDTFVPVPLPSPVAVRAGTPYAIVVTGRGAGSPGQDSDADGIPDDLDPSPYDPEAPGSGAYVWGGASGNPYGGGTGQWKSILEDGANWMADGDFDHAFKTYVRKKPK